MRKLVTYLCLTLLLHTTLFADFGDNPLQWSSTESADFQDFAIRTFNRQGNIVNSYWPHFWLSQTLIDLNHASPKKIDHTIPLILNQPTINAFAIPGNVIGIHTGLWQFADNESELISVLAHETAHIALDHFSRLTQNANQQSLKIASGILFAILLAQNNSELANASLLATLAATQQSRLNFSRAMEVEADQLAQSILENSKYDPEAGGIFFQKLDRNSAIDSAYEFLMTHPLGNTRSANLSSVQSQKDDRTDKNLFIFLSTYLLTGSIDTSIKLDIETSPADPNLRFAIAMQSFAKTNDNGQYMERLQELNDIYPDFLPAKYERLSRQVEQQDAQLCKDFHTLQNNAQSQFLTLNVIEELKKAAELCQHRSAAYWHAKLMWQSGQEPKALNYLTKAIRLEADTNQIARLKQQLNQYNARYERFR